MMAATKPNFILVLAAAMCGVVVFPAVALTQGVEGDPARGQRLFRQLGCLECHTVRGEGGGGETKAPELSTVFGETVELEDGSRVEANEEYLLRAITDPNVQVVKGYPAGKMPVRFANLPHDDLGSLVAYLKVLPDKELADRVLAATSLDVPIEIAPARRPVGIWVVLGLGALGLLATNVVNMSRRLSWAWVGLIVALPAVGGAAGVGWVTAAASAGRSYKEFEIVARQFAYDPAVIRVNKGDTVTITLRSEDTLHGFYVDGYGIDQEIRPGEVARLTFTATKSGKFGIRCSHTCGVFHPFMSGTLLVAPNNLFAGSLGLAFGLGLAAFLYVSKKPE